MSPETREQRKQDLARLVYNAIPDPKATFDELYESATWHNAFNIAVDPICDAIAWSGPGKTRRSLGEQPAPALQESLQNSEGNSAESEGKVGEARA